LIQGTTHAYEKIITQQGKPVSTSIKSSILFPLWVLHQYFSLGHEVMWVKIQATITNNKIRTEIRSRKQKDEYRVAASPFSFLVILEGFLLSYSCK